MKPVSPTNNLVTVGLLGGPFDGAKVDAILDVDEIKIPAVKPGGGGFAFYLYHKTGDPLRYRSVDTRNDAQ